MAYLRRLIHTCDLYRPTVAATSTGASQATMPGSPTTAGIKCLLHPRPSRRDLQPFGADVRCDALVFFPYGTDVRPKLASSDGKNDRLKITDELGAVTYWTVEATREPASARRFVVAAVRVSAS